MAYSFKGSISFGMVYIPIKLESAVSENTISFNQLDKKTMSRIRYIKTCEACDGKIVEAKDIVKGYQYEKDKYIIFEDSDFEKIKSKKEKSITIEQFVNLDEIDPIYYNKVYYVVPSGAEKAFSLLKNALEKEKKVGIAKTVIGTKETVVALRVKNGEMLLNTLYFAAEIKVNPAKNVDEKSRKQEMDIALMIIKNMSAKFEPEKYKDEYNEKILKAIESKISGKNIVAPKEKETDIGDLMEALKLSLESSKAESAEGVSAKIKTAGTKKQTAKKSTKDGYAAKKS